jgi:DNA-binding CsgD family transcriptional regulator
MGVTEVVGRESELEAIGAFLGLAVGEPAALVLEGEAGIGKSTLWTAAVSAARERGHRVLVSRPAEAERAFALSALGDLFEDISEETLSALPRPRRRALEVALLRADAQGEVADDRALAVGVRDVLHLLAARSPVLIAVDDVQWLDPSSSSALAFALRRLDGSPVLALLARRIDGSSEASDVERAIAPERLMRLEMGPLSLGALHRLLQEQRGRAFAHQTLVRIRELSGGNPFFALELARTLNADIGPLEPIPIPESLEELVRARLSGLPDATRYALAFAAAVGRPSVSLLRNLGVEPEVLEPAVAAQVIDFQGDEIRFANPLLSSVLYGDLGARRRTVHERIAGVVDDPVTRARHLALATDAPSPAVAEAMDAAARAASDRGAAASAAELADAALRLTPPRDTAERHRRAMAAAHAHLTAGEWTRARAIARDLLEEPHIGAMRADVLVLLADLEGLDRATELLEEALRQANARPALQALILCRLAWTARFKEGFDGAFAHARRALELADEVDDDGLRLEAIRMLAFLGSAIGDADARAFATRGVEIADALGDPRLMHRARLSLIETAAASRERRTAGPLLTWLYEDSRDRDELAAADALESLASFELRTGQWARAAAHAESAYDLTMQYGLEVPWAHLAVAMIAAHRGQLEIARSHSERALRLAEEQFGRHTPVHLGTLGFVARQSGDLEAADRWFAESRAVTTALRWHDAGRRWWVGDHVETLLELGRVDEAVRIIAEWEAERNPDDDWTRGHVTRCLGLVEAARGEVAGAGVLLTEAIAQHEAAQDAFGRARAMLALGVVRRRERQKRAAREAITAALAGFEELGARTWVDRARAELGRIGGRTTEPGLTAAELRVAALVAEGRTNKEVAAALYLGQRTVETHLSHVYAKLGVRSRAELARRFPPDGQSSGEPTITG